MTTEREGLEDYYLFVQGTGIVGAYAELQQGTTLDGQEALERAVEVTDGVVDFCALSPEAVERLLLASPSLRVRGLEGRDDDIEGLGGCDYSPKREVLLKKYGLKEPSKEFVDSVIKDFLG